MSNGYLLHMQRQTVKATYTYIYVTFQLPVAATAPDATSSQRPLEAATTVCSLRMRRRMLDFHLNEASAAVVHGGSSVVPRSLDVGAGDAGAVMARRVGGCSLLAPSASAATVVQRPLHVAVHQDVVDHA